MKMSKFVMLLVLFLLVVPNLVHARPEGEGVKEWKEAQLEISKKRQGVSKSISSESVSCEVRVLTLDPNFPIYFVKDTCLSWGLTVIPNPLGMLYCKLGFWTDNNTFAVFSAIPGKNTLKGWQYCKEI